MYDLRGVGGRHTAVVVMEGQLGGGVRSRRTNGGKCECGAFIQKKSSCLSMTGVSQGQAGERSRDQMIKRLVFFFRETRGCGSRNEGNIIKI